MNLEQIFSKLEGKIAREELEKRIKEKIDEFGGLLSEEGAALIVAADLGVDLRLEKPREFLEVKDLAIGMSDIWLCARVICVSAMKEFQRDSGTGKVTNVEVMDGTGSTRIVLWDDLAESATELRKGEIVEIRGGYVKKGFREGLEIHLSSSRRAEIRTITDTDKDIPEFKMGCISIEDLQEEMADVDVAGRVGQLYGIREFQRNGGTGKVASLSLIDNTGEIRLCLWNDKADAARTMKRGDIIVIENGYTKMGLNGLELHSGWRGRVLQNRDIEIQELPELERVNLIDLLPGHSYNVSGTVTEISEKRSFVRSDGSPGQLARFSLQDESAEIRIVLWNEKADDIDNLVKGVPVLIDNGFAKEGMEGLELHVSSLGQIVLQEQFTPETKAFNIEKGPVTIVGRYYQGALIDESGRIPLASDDSITDGQLLRVKGLFNTEIAPDEIEEITEEFPSLESLLHPPRRALSEVKEEDYVEVHALVKKVCDFGAHKRIKIDDSTAEVAGIVFGDMTEGEEYCFYARIYKRTAGIEFICYQYHSVEAEEEAFDMIREIEGLMEV